MANQFHVGQGYFSIGAKFDSRNRYIRKVANAADKTLNMCRGSSIAFNPINNGEAGWRWQCNAATRASGTSAAAPGAGFNTGINATI